jgi:DNA-binding response OmpR family regulator
MAKILLVEDDEDFAIALEESLAGHLVEHVSKASDASLRLKLSKYDLVILDWGLPDMPGVELCKQFRAQKVKTPILVLTGRSSVEDKVAGLQAGADDYMTKPMHTDELAARIQALLRRPATLVPDNLKVGDLELDSNEYVLYRKGEPIRLLPKEFDLLAFFMRHPGQLFSPDSLLDRVWPSETGVSKELVRVYITKLRGKIDKEGEPSVIATVHGRGYRLDTN